MTGQEILNFRKQFLYEDIINELVIFRLYENAVLDNFGNFLKYVLLHFEDDDYNFQGTLEEFEQYIKEYPQLDYKNSYLCKKGHKIVIVCIQKLTADSYIYAEDLEFNDYYISLEQFIECNKKEVLVND